MYDVDGCVYGAAGEEDVSMRTMCGAGGGLSLFFIFFYFFLVFKRCFQN